MWKKIDHGPSDDDDNDDEEQIVQHTADHIFSLCCNLHVDGFIALLSNGQTLGISLLPT